MRLSVVEQFVSLIFLNRDITVASRINIERKSIKQASTSLRQCFRYRSLNSDIETPWVNQAQIFASGETRKRPNDADAWNTEEQPYASASMCSAVALIHA